MAASEIISACLVFLKLSPRYLKTIMVSLAAISLFGAGITAPLLFLPNRVLEYLCVCDFTQNNCQYIGPVFVSSVVVIVVDGAIYIILCIRNAIYRHKSHKGQLQRLRTLTEQEKHILRYYVNKKTRTNRLYGNDGIVQGLVSAGIIFQASDVGYGRFKFDYNIAEFSRDYIDAHTEILIGTTPMDTDRTDKYLDGFR